MRIEYSVTRHGGNGKPPLSFDDPAAMTSAAAPSVRIERDVPYGTGEIGYGTGSPGSRPLLLDVYLPPDVDGTTPPAGGWPTLVFAHGGAYHRGSKEKDEFEQEGLRNTGVNEYAERFARRGFVAVSVGYRLTQELPPPQAEPIKRVRDKVERDRIDFVRKLMGLPPATDAELLNGSEAAITDVTNAFRFVHANASRWGINPARMLIGGFSAGAFCAAYATYVFGVPSRAVIAFSGGTLDKADSEYYLQPERPQFQVQGKVQVPPLLLFEGEFDLPSIPTRAGWLAEGVKRVGGGVRHYKVMGRGHFYEHDSPIVVMEEDGLSGGDKSATVEAAVQQFIGEVL